MSHDHGEHDHGTHGHGTHGHGGHAHSHAVDASTPSHRRRLAIALGITATVLVAQLVGTVVTGSLALLVDLVHMAVDTSGLVLALVAATLMARPASKHRTWGFRRAEVIAAALQAGILAAVAIFATIEAIQRLVTPTEVDGPLLVWFGVIGLVGNLISLAVLASARKENLNLRAAFLEVTADALGSVAVIAGAAVIWLTGWTRADAIAGLVVCALIVPRALVLLKETGSILLESTPPGLDLDEVRTHLLALEHVHEVHDLHASRIATGMPVLSAHVVVDRQCFHDGHTAELLHTVQSCVAEHFPVSVEHSTIQFEPVGHVDPERGICTLPADHGQDLVARPPTLS